MMGFFTSTEKDRGRVVGSIPHCGSCGLFKKCLNPKIPLAGEGQRKILVVGEAPGAEEDKRGKPFIGSAGQLLQEGLKAAGINLFRDCWVTNSVVCRPPENRDPTPDELKHCLPNLMNVMRETRPEVVLLLGRFAIMQVIGQLWDSGVGSGMRWLGWRIPSIDWNAWLCPVYHPAFIKRKLQEDEIESLLWRQQLKEMGKLSGRPWEQGVPDYGKRIRRVYDQEKVRDCLDRFMQNGRPVAFDYECDRLKPDHPESRIYCCAVSDGDISVTYPWTKETALATRDLLWSDLPKMGWNLKYEERWTRKIFGKGVRNWFWDGMLATHVLDNRQEITSLKFQAFVRLGIRSYDTAMSTYFQSDSSNDRNRIRDADMKELLFYNGMDALCTAMIGKMQREEIYGNDC